MHLKWKQRKNLVIKSYKAAGKRTRIRNRLCDVDVGSAQADDTIQSPRDRFRTESFLVIIDQLQAALKRRLDAYSEIIARRARVP